MFVHKPTIPYLSSVVQHGGKLFLLCISLPLSHLFVLTREPAHAKMLFYVSWVGQCIVS